MARVIKIDKEKEKKITHDECGAVVGYFENEVKYESIQDYGGGSDTYGHIKCPNCNKKIQWAK